MVITVDGIKTAYSEEGTGSTVLILHGWSKKKEDYEELAGLLSQNRRVVRIDLPGFGESDLPPRPFGVSDYAEFVFHFIQKVAPDQLVVVGHSFGGRVAIKLASYRGDFLNRLILVDSAGIERKPFLTKIFIKFAQLVPSLAKNTLSSFLGSSDYTKLSGVMKETFKKVVNENLEDDLAKIKIPTLIIWGKDDRTTPFWHGELMHKLVENSKLIVVPGANHGLPYRNAGETAEIIGGFIL